MADSLAIEAKLKDWRRALRQVSTFAGLVNRTAILMPEVVSMRIPSDFLDFYGTGVIAESKDRVYLHHSPPPRPLNLSAQAWLLELLIRGLEQGTAYRYSSRTNESRDSANDSTLA